MKISSSDLTMIRDRVRVAEAWTKEKFEKARRPETMRKWFIGDHYGKGSPLEDKTQDKIVVNHILNNILVKRDSICFGIPRFVVNPKGREWENAAKTQRNALNYVWREIKAKKATDRAYLDARVYGTGVVATNWRFEERTVKEQPDEFGQMQNVPIVVHDDPQVRRLIPGNFGYDPDAGEDWREGWYCFEKWKRPLIQMQKSPRYTEVVDKLKGNTMLPEELFKASGFDRDPKNQDKHLRAVTGYTVYLQDMGMVVEITDELTDEVLWASEEDYPQDWRGRPYYPFVVLQGVAPDLETAYGLSEVETVETQQMEIDLGRSQLTQARRSNNTQYLIDDQLGDLAKVALEEGKHGTLIELPVRPDLPLDKRVTTVPRGDIQAEVYAVLDKAATEMQVLSGGGYRSGMPMPGTKFATETMMIAQGADVRINGDRARFEEFVAEVAEQVCHLLHRYGSKPREVGGPKGEWGTYTGEQIQGDYEFLVEPGSMDPPDSAAEEGKWATRLQLLVPLTQFGYNVRPVVEAYLNSFDSPDVDLILPPEQSPTMSGILPGQGAMGNEGINAGLQVGGGGESGVAEPGGQAEIATALGLG